MTTLLAVIDISQRPWIVESRQIPEYESRVQYAQVSHGYKGSFSSRTTDSSQSYIQTPAVVVGANSTHNSSFNFIHCRRGHHPYLAGGPSQHQTMYSRHRQISKNTCSNW